MTDTTTTTPGLRTVADVRDWIESHDTDDPQVDDDELDAAWLVVFGSAPDAQDIEDGTYSLLCARVDSLG